jgi:cytochrome bd-type quinol oxidase subunit 1
MRTLEARAMSGFIMAVLVAIAVQLFQSAEDWWPMGRKLFGALLVTAVLGLAVVEAGHYISADGNVRAILLGR